MDGDARRALRQRLESLAAAGVETLPKRRGRRGSTTGPQSGAATSSPPPQPAGRKPAATTPVSVAAADRTTALQLLRTEVAGCTRCSDLAAARTQTVFGSGPPDARICFFGEAPGADEDASGEPFVGRAGQLLTKIIEACTLSRDQVYILNVLKCRPPGNRTPLPDEVGNCRGYFERQLEIIAPEFICCLGTTAAQALLRTNEPIGRLRGRWFTHGSAHVLCTYHPSYLLRNPAAKRDVWADMQLLMERMGLKT
jgi:DNA polymerase